MISIPPNRSAATAESTLRIPKNTAAKTVLPNGLTVIVQEDRSAPVASVQAWCRTGSIHEDVHLGAGLSHILEHMLFKGTEKRDTAEIAQVVQDEGGYINAYTSFDRTVFWIDIPAKGVSTAVEVLADAMMNSTLPPEEYVKEQEVIRREFAMGFDDPDRMSTLLMFATAYSEHPYQMPVIGHLDLYNKLTRDDVMRYYKERYVPNNLVFVVVGDVNGLEVVKQLEVFFKDQPRTSLKPVYIPREPKQLGRRDHHVEFETELTRLDMVWHIPELIHPDTPALDLLATVLGHGASSRLYREIRQERGLAHSISAFSYTPGHPGLFGIGATLDPDKRLETEMAVLSAMGEIKENGVTAQELEKARNLTLSSHFHGLTTMRGKASDIGSNWLLTRNLNFSSEYIEAIRRVTVDDLQRVVQKYCIEENLTVTSLIPKGSLSNISKVESKAGDVGDIRKFMLPNGLRLLIREDPRLPLVSVRAVFKGGVLAEDERSNGVSRLMSQVLPEGTKNRTAEEIANTIESVGGNLSSESGNNSISIAVRVMRPDLEMGLDVISDITLNPTWPEKAIAREKEIQLAGLKVEEEEMTTVARNLLRRTLYSGHPYALRPLGTPESVGELNAQKLSNFHREHFVGKNGVIAIFGDIKADEVKSLVEKYFGSMPEGEEALITPPAPKILEKTATVEEFRSKHQAVVMVGFLAADFSNPDRDILELIDEASSDLGSRFFIRIREEMGLAYYVGTSQMPGLCPGLFVFYLGTSPEMAEEVKTEFLSEIENLATHGLTGVELARAKEKLIGRHQIRNQSNEALAYRAALDELFGVGYNDYLNIPDRINAVTLQDVRSVAAKYFRNASGVIAIVRPAPFAEKIK